MPTPPPTRGELRRGPSRSALRRRRIRQRRTVVAASAIIVLALSVGVAGFVRSLSEHNSQGTAAAAATTIESASPTPTPTVAAPTFDTAAYADEAMEILADYSDAARKTEDALYEATEKLRAATTADEADAARAETDDAVAAVKADAEAYRASLIEASADTNTQPTDGDVTAQLDYLHEYVFTYNSDEWGDYNDYGGDCTNFVSQGLIARGWEVDDTWYSAGAMWTATKPWIATAAMASYFDSLGLSYTTEDDLDRVRVGDIGLFSWGETAAGMDHTMTVSKVEYVPGEDPKVYFISHNDDAEYRELIETLYEEHEDSTVRIYEIP
ncbi:MAG: amidase domain-containing protein [Microbacterium sp.]